MPSVFLSYRRDDRTAVAGRLCDRLSARFGADQVFMDIDDIAPGQQFADVLNDTLKRCDVLVILIGPGWLQGAADNIAAQECPEVDFVHHEIEQALQRNIPLIPVLLDGASLPARENLPPQLHAMLGFQAIEIHHNHFGADAQRLIDAIEQHGRNSRPALWRRPVGIVLALLVVAAAIVAVSHLFSLQPQLQLRAEPQTLSPAAARALITRHGFYDAAWNRSGSGIEHRYEVQVIGEDIFVSDLTTGLDWHKGGSVRQQPFAEVVAYLEALNAARFGGHSNWRLPTIEEAMSLLTPATGAVYHIDSVFEASATPALWTADSAPAGGHWVVYLADAIVRPASDQYNAWIKAVRSRD